MPESAKEGSDPYRYDPETSDLDKMFNEMEPEDLSRSGPPRGWGGSNWAEVVYSRLSPEEAQERLKYDLEHSKNDGAVALGSVRKIVDQRSAAKDEREQGRAQAGIST